MRGSTYFVGFSNGTPLLSQNPVALLASSPNWYGWIICDGLRIDLLTKEVPGFSIATGNGSAKRRAKFSSASARAARRAAPTSVPGLTFW